MDAEHTEKKEEKPSDLITGIPSLQESGQEEVEELKNPVASSPIFAVYKNLVKKKVKTTHFVPQTEKDWVYLIHHMHPGKVIETLDHCFLFSDKNEKAKKHSQKHVVVGGQTFHVVSDDAPDILFDHLNNEFKIVTMELNGKEYRVIKGPVRLKEIKWSAQDR